MLSSLYVKPKSKLDDNAMEHNKEVFDNCKRILDKSNNIEDVLVYLRENEYSKAWAMIMLTKLQDIDFGEAQKLVHFSETWSDVRERDEKFFGTFIEATEKAIEESGGTLELNKP